MHRKAYANNDTASVLIYPVFACSGIAALAKTYYTLGSANCLVILVKLLADL